MAKYASMVSALLAVAKQVSSVTTTHKFAMLENARLDADQSVILATPTAKSASMAHASLVVEESASPATTMPKFALLERARLDAS